MENSLKNCLTIQVSEEDVNSPYFDLANYVNKKIKKAWLEYELTGHHFPFNYVNNSK